MALVKCTGCNKFIESGKTLCDDCMITEFSSFSEDKKEEAFVAVREYIYDNPNTPKTQVADDTGVPLKMISQWIKDGKLEEVLGGTSGERRCTECGRKIQSGLVCESCKKRVINSMDKGKDTNKFAYLQK